MVGRIESLTESLTQLGRRAGLDEDLGAMQAGPLPPRHASEVDKVAALEKQAMTAFLERSPTWIAQLMHRYSPDVCAFGYNQSECPSSPFTDELRDKIIMLV